MEHRYRDKKYLSEYTLDASLFDKFDFVVEDVIPIRNVYMLNTDDGMKILKKVMYNIDELNFIYNSLNHIRKTYKNIVNFKLSTSGNGYVEDETGLYIVLDVIEGRECVFENPIDLKNASKSLAMLHEAGNKIDIFHEKRFKSGRILEKYKRALNEMKTFKDIASMHVNKSDFDKIYLEYVDYYMGYIEDAIGVIESSNYLKYSRDKYVLCHHDLAHHNILISPENEVHFLDFDYCVIDLPMHDISNMMTKAIKNNRWDVDIANTIIKSYSEVSNLYPDEKFILYGYLLFPKDFYDISSSYYLKTRTWSEEEFLDKMIRKSGYKDHRQRFLREFNRI